MEIDNNHDPIALVPMRSPYFRGVGYVGGCMRAGFHATNIARSTVVKSEEFQGFLGQS